jgi:transposase
VPGGISKEVVVSQALALLEGVAPAGAAAVERHRLALEVVDDLDHLETQRMASKARIRTAVAASGTTLTDIFGVGDVVAASLIGHSGDIDRFPTGDRFAADNGTAPSEWSSGNPSGPPAVPTRQPGHEPRPAHRRGHPAPPLPQHGPSLL